LVLENEELAGWVSAHLDLQWVAHPAVREILASRLRLQQQGAWPGLTPWLSQVKEPEWQSLITELLVDARPIKDAEALLKGSATRVRDHFVERQLADLSRRLEAPDVPELEQMRIEREKDTLRRLKRQPLAAQAHASGGS
jgi:thioredoxin-like negative regulator of GroEL